MIKMHFQSLSPQHNEQEDVSTLTLTLEEKNALRYACGYIPYKLRRKFSSRQDQKSQTFLSCLESMCIGGPSTLQYDYLDYTREWITLVNRGGVVQVNDEAFLMFCAIEHCVRREFCRRKFKVHSDLNRKKIITENALVDPQVRRHWTHLVKTELDWANELLQLIIEYWTDIRGHSFAGAWLELYKQAKHHHGKALRKQLKQTS